MIRFTVEIIVDEADAAATRRALEVIESKFAVDGGFDYTVNNDVAEAKLVAL